MRDLPMRARLYVEVVAVLGIATLLLAAVIGTNWDKTVSLVVMMVVLARTGYNLDSVHSSHIGLVMTLPVATAAYIVVGPAAAAFVGAGTLLVGGTMPVFKRVFNAALFVIAAATAGLVYVAADGPVGKLGAGDFPRIVIPVLLANVTYCVVNAFLLAGIVYLAQGVSPSTVLRGTILKSAPSYLGYGFFGLLVSVLWVGVGIEALSVVLVMAPLLAARWAFSQYALEKQAYEATIRALVQAVETKDNYTRGHSERVAKASVMIARVLGMREDRLNALRYAGILHDVGKLGVPTKILQKSEGLTDEEYAAIQLHPLRGREMVAEIEFLGEAFDGILHHHERMDGRGYPMGLAGNDIPQFARIIAVADAFDSMTSTRSYRSARTVPDAMDELERCKDTQFDPLMVDAMVTALAREGWSSLQAFEDPDVVQHVPLGIDHDDPTLTQPLRPANQSGGLR
jgi:hypothetical protein